MKVLTIVIHDEIIHNSVFNLFGAAYKLNNCFDVLSIGTNEQATELSEYNGVNCIMHCDLPNPLLAENISPIIAEFAHQYSHILIAANNVGKNILPRVAGKLQVGQISEIVEIVSPNVFKKFMYAGNVLVEIESLEDIKLLTVRTANFPEFKQKSNSNANIINITSKYIENRVMLIDKNITTKNTIDLTNAQIIVSGGRSLSSKENFDSHIRILAKKLNAAVGATRAAVEASLAENNCQVGQTGKVVAPKLYIAIGISGAVQHIAGMKDSNKVVAINIDANAQIFEYADYGIVGDLFELVPQLIDKLD